MGISKEKLKDIRGKVLDHLKVDAIKTAILVTSLFNTNGSKTSAMPIESRTNTDVETVYNNASSNNLYIEVEDEAMNHDLITDNLISNNKNTINNFDLGEREFSAEELEMLNESPSTIKLLQKAKKIAKTRTPTPGEPTYCLRGVKNILAANGIQLEADRFAYQAIDGLRKNDHFVEINANADNFRSLPDGAVIVWEKGTTRYGHIAMKIGEKEYCDFVYNLRTHNNRGRSGQRYGKPHVFVLKDIQLSQELTKQLVSEGLLDSSEQKRCIASNEISKMKNILSQKDNQLLALSETDKSKHISLEFLDYLRKNRDNS